MKGSCAAPMAEFHPARAGPSVRTRSEPSELKAIGANPNRSRPVGYAGVSTADQNLALPEGADRSRMRKKNFTEHVSGAAIDRPAPFEAMKSVHEGDTLVWKLDRLARSARQLIDTVDALRERGAAFGGGRGYARRSEPSGRHDRRARCMLRFAVERLVCLTRLLRSVKAIKLPGRGAGKARPACRPETEARACLWAFLIRAGRGRSYH